MERRCTAKSKQSGERCKRPASPGSNVCSMHGSRSPQARAKARMRLAEEGARVLLAGVDHDPVTDPVTALAALAGEVLALKDLFATNVDELRDWTYTDRPGREEVHAILAAYERSLDRCHRVLEGMSRLDIEDRLARITERHGELIVQVLLASLRRCDVPDEWSVPLQAALAIELRAMA